jgi:hypothetical protein
VPGRCPRDGLQHVSPVQHNRWLHVGDALFAQERRCPFAVRITFLKRVERCDEIVEAGALGGPDGGVCRLTNAVGDHVELLGHSGPASVVEGETRFPRLYCIEVIPRQDDPPDHRVVLAAGVLERICLTSTHDRCVWPVPRLLQLGRDASK